MCVYFIVGTFRKMYDDKPFWEIVAKISDCPCIHACVEHVLLDGVFYGYALKPDINLQNLWNLWTMMDEGQYAYGYFTTEENAKRILDLMKQNPLVKSGCVKVFMQQREAAVLKLYNSTRIVIPDHFYLMGCSDGLQFFKPISVDQAVVLLQQPNEARQVRVNRMCNNIFISSHTNLYFGLHLFKLF